MVSCPVALVSNSARPKLHRRRVCVCVCPRRPSQTDGHGGGLPGQLPTFRGAFTRAVLSVGPQRLCVYSRHSRVPLHVRRDGVAESLLLNCQGRAWQRCANARCPSRKCWQRQGTDTPISQLHSSSTAACRLREAGLVVQAREGCGPSCWSELKTWCMCRTVFHKG